MRLEFNMANMTKHLAVKNTVIDFLLRAAGTFLRYGDTVSKKEYMWKHLLLNGNPHLFQQVNSCNSRSLVRIGIWDGFVKLC